MAVSSSPFLGILNLEIMPASRYLTICFLLLTCGACIEPFEPEIEESQQVLVINGSISDEAGVYYVEISRSAPYKQPSYDPLEGCVVFVSDQDGHMIHYKDEGDGLYSADVPDSFLEVGDAVSIYVATPDLREYRSSYETILSCPDIDSVYYEIQSMETSDSDRNLEGIQFYLDLSGTPGDSRNVIWRIDETWEYWASLIGNFRWLGPTEMEEFRNYTIFKCWKNYPLSHLYTGTTRNLSINELQRVTLNYVSNETDRLYRVYSLLVKQEALSMEAYDYWQRLNEQTAESGGLYEKQPSASTGNLYSVNDSEEVALGFFYAGQVREKRIFVVNDKLFDFDIPHISCEYEPLSSLWGKDNIEYPVYIYRPGPFQPAFWGPSECFDCTLQGGNNIRPDYWISP